MTVIASMREYFLLSDARATAKIVPEDARLAIGRHLAVGRQRAEAADALWSNGHVAEGLRLAAEAFDGTLQALGPFEEAIGPRGELAAAHVRAPSPVELDPTRDGGELEARTEPGDEETAGADEQDAGEDGATHGGDESSEGRATEASADKASAADEARASEESAGEASASEESAGEASASEDGASEPGASEDGASEPGATDDDAGEDTASEPTDDGATDSALAGADEAPSDEDSDEVARSVAAPSVAASPVAASSIAASSIAAHEDAVPSGEPAWAASVRRRGLSDAKLRTVLETDRALRGKALPLLDDEVSAAEGELFQQLVTARRHIEGVLSAASMTPGQLAWTRTSRIGFAAVLGIAIVAGLYFLLRPPTGVEATASGQWSAEFTPERAIDGDEASEWLLPDRSEGWLDVRIMPAEHIGTLRLKNSHNRHYNDRATNEYTVELFSNGQVVRTIEGSWQGIAPRPPWTEHELDVDDVERIRVNIRSWHRNGGGLAELDWE